MLPWLDSLIVLVIIVLATVFLYRLIQCGQRANSQAREQSELYGRVYPPGTRQPSWVPPREPPTAHLRSISRELMHSIAITTSPGGILTRTYPLTNPPAYTLGLTPNRAGHPSPSAPDAAHMV